MLKKALIGLLLVAYVCAVVGCDGDEGNDALDTIEGAIESLEEAVPTEVTQWGADLVDAVDEGAESLGIPNGVSGEVYKKVKEIDWQEAASDPDFFK